MHKEAIDLLSKAELAKLSDKDIDTYHTVVQNFKDSLRKYMLDIVVERESRGPNNAEVMLDAMTSEQRAALAKYIKAEGIESLEA